MLAHGRDAGSELLEALGLRHQHVRRVAIDACVDGLAVVTVEHYLDEEQLDAVARRLRGMAEGRFDVRSVPLGRPARGFPRVEKGHDGNPEEGP